MSAKPTEELVLEVQNRKAAAKAAASHSADLVSDPAAEVAQVLDKAPLVQLPEPFPGDYPFLAIKKDLLEMQRVVTEFSKSIEGHLDALERHWPRTPEGATITADRTEETVTVACDDYAAHRSSHRRTANGWECDICSMKGVEAVVAALGEDVAAAPAGWVCPEHHLAKSLTSKRTGQKYLACPEADCVEREP